MLSFFEYYFVLWRGPNTLFTCRKAPVLKLKSGKSVQIVLLSEKSWYDKWVYCGWADVLTDDREQSYHLSLYYMSYTGFMRISFL